MFFYSHTSYIATFLVLNMRTRDYVEDGERMTSFNYKENIES